MRINVLFLRLQLGAENGLLVRAHPPGFQMAALLLTLPVAKRAGGFLVSLTLFMKH